MKAALTQAVLGERDIAQARGLIREALIAEQQVMGDKHCDYARLLMIAGNVEEAGRQKAQANKFYREALAVYRDSVGARNPERTEAEQSYVRFAKSLRKE